MACRFRRARASRHESVRCWGLCVKLSTGSSSRPQLAARIANSSLCLPRTGSRTSTTYRPASHSSSLAQDPGLLFEAVRALAYPRNGGCARDQSPGARRVAPAVQIIHQPDAVFHAGGVEQFYGGMAVAKQAGAFHMARGSGAVHDLAKTAVAVSVRSKRFCRCWYGRRPPAAGGRLRQSWSAVHGQPHAMAVVGSGGMDVQACNAGRYKALHPGGAARIGVLAAGGNSRMRARYGRRLRR